MLITPIYHVVVNGHIPGIYTSYQEALEQVKDYDDGKLRNYPTMKQARVAWSGYKSIAREKSIAFPIPKKLLLSHSINMGLKATVVLTSVSNPEVILKSFKEMDDQSILHGLDRIVEELNQFGLDLQKRSIRLAKQEATYAEAAQTLVAVQERMAKQLESLMAYLAQMPQDNDDEARKVA